MEEAKAIISIIEVAIVVDRRVPRVRLRVSTLPLRDHVPVPVIAVVHVPNPFQPVREPRVVIILVVVVIQPRPDRPLRRDRARTHLLRHVPNAVELEDLLVRRRIGRATPEALAPIHRPPIRRLELVERVIRIRLTRLVSVRLVLVPQHVPHRVKPIYDVLVLDTVPVPRVLGLNALEPAAIRVIDVRRVYPIPVLDVRPLPVLIVRNVDDVIKVRREASSRHRLDLSAAIIAIRNHLVVGIRDPLHSAEVVALVRHPDGFRATLIPRRETGDPPLLARRLTQAPIGIHDRPRLIVGISNRGSTFKGPGVSDIEVV